MSIDERPVTHPLLVGEQRIAANGIEIAYQTFGDPTATPMLLVMGLGTQMLGWPEDLCEDLASQGHYVVRYDNRDIGCSTHLNHLPTPTMADMRGYATRRKAPPYAIADMADDALALIDALGLGTVHLVGVSMGGFISQTVAIKQPDRLRSLTLMLTSTGSRRVGQPRPGVLWNMSRQKEPSTREAAVAATVVTYRAIGSKGYPFDEAYLRSKAEASFDRDHDDDGYTRQLAAVIAQPNRTAALAQLRLPTLVIHGLADPLVRPSGGISLAKTIPGTKFVGYEGMGHDLPRPLWPDMGAQIGALAKRADQA
ncbi:MAG: alpha/beta hydrolase fold protein [Acidimicrobiales bacterium]|nr:alpha/beta hydrolase fold protein [Acidimicrobiales bacterium]